MSEDDLRKAIPMLDEQSQRALAAAQQWIGTDVQGVAIGTMASGATCVVVYVLDPDSDEVRSLPRQCEGLPVRVEPGDQFTALA